MPKIEELQKQLSQIRDQQARGFTAGVALDTYALVLDALAAADAYIQGLPFEASADHDRAIDAFDAAMDRLEVPAAPARPEASAETLADEAIALDIAGKELADLVRGQSEPAARPEASTESCPECARRSELWNKVDTLAERVLGEPRNAAALAAPSEPAGNTGQARSTVATGRATTSGF
jgi:hypothetical protein